MADEAERRKKLIRERLDRAKAMTSARQSDLKKGALTLKQEPARTIESVNKFQKQDHASQITQSTTIVSTTQVNKSISSDISSDIIISAPKVIVQPSMQSGYAKRTGQSKVTNDIHSDIESGSKVQKIMYGHNNPGEISLDDVKLTEEMCLSYGRPAKFAVEKVISKCFAKLNMKVVFD